MYDELDNLLSQETTIDSWYDDGFIIAQDILNDFSTDDWQELEDSVLNKSLDWQKKLVYCLDNQMIEEEIEIIIKLFDTEDDELLEMCADSLRCFDNKMGHAYIKAHPDIIEKVRRRKDSAGDATKRVLEVFLETFKICQE